MPLQRKRATIIEDNWLQVKQLLRSFCEKLSQDDVEELTGYSSLLAKIKLCYELSDAGVEEKIDYLIEKLGLGTLNSTCEALYASGVEAKERITESLEKSLSHLKDYVKEYPVPSFVCCMLAGIALKKILTHTKKS